MLSDRDNTDIVETPQLGLAAYIKMKGGELLEVKNGSFRFKTYQPLKEWQMEYANSCCQRHDQELVHLRNLRGGRK